MSKLEQDNTRPQGNGSSKPVPSKSEPKKTNNGYKKPYVSRTEKYCNYCNLKGHNEDECRKKLRNKNKASGQTTGAKTEEQHMREFVVNLQVQESEEEAVLQEAIEELEESTNRGEESTNHGDESTEYVSDESYELYAQSSNEAQTPILTTNDHISNTDLVTEVTAVLHKFVDSEGKFIKVKNALLDTGSSKTIIASHCIPKK